MRRDKYYEKVYQRLVKIQGAFLSFCIFSQKHIVFINQRVYNSGILVEVYHDNIGYDKRVV